MLERFEVHTDFELPYWFGDDEFHRSHQSNLLRKDLDFYSKHFIGVPDTLAYKWFPEFKSDLTNFSLRV
jgi:hypothetical protein